MTVKDKMEAKVYDRCKFVVEEIARTQEAAKLLQQNNLIEFGKKMYEAHEGLSKLYEVSCKELDFLVEKAKENRCNRCKNDGWRLWGLHNQYCKKRKCAQFLSNATVAYQKKFQIDPEVIKVEVEDGTHPIQ